MPSMKRRRDSSASKQSSRKTDGSESDAQEIFRRHFEAQFGQIRGLPPKTQDEQKASKKREAAREAAGETYAQVDDDGWTGFSDNGEDWKLDNDDEDEERSDESEGEGNDENDDPVAEVIEYDFSKRSSAPSIERPTKATSKKFMSSRPPALSTTPSATTISRSKKSTAGDEDDDGDSANLKNDLSLQRLLTESHLLDQTTLSHASGRNRHLATESRIQLLGGKVLDTNPNTPMHIRKGIVKKGDEREVKRRKDAKEAGIVLEHKKAKKRDGGYKDRDHGIGGPSIGKFKGGALILSKEDVQQMTSERRGGARGRGGRGTGR